MEGRKHENDNIDTSDAEKDDKVDQHLDESQLTNSANELCGELDHDVSVKETEHSKFEINETDSIGSTIHAFEHDIGSDEIECTHDKGSDEVPNCDKQVIPNNSNFLINFWLIFLIIKTEFELQPENSTENNIGGEENRLSQELKMYDLASVEIDKQQDKMSERSEPVVGTGAINQQEPICKSDMEDISETFEQKSKTENCMEVDTCRNDASEESDEKSVDGSERSDCASKSSYVANEKSDDVSKMSYNASEKSDDASEIFDDASEKSEDVSSKTDDASKKSDDANEKSDEESEKPDDTSKLLDDSSENSDDASEKLDDASDKKDYAIEKKDDASKQSVDATENSDHASEKSDDASEKIDDVSEKSVDVSEKSDDVSKKSVDAIEKTGDVSEVTDDNRKMSDDASVESDETSEKSDDMSKRSVDASVKTDDISEETDDVSVKSDEATEILDDASEKSDNASKILDDASEIRYIASKILDDSRENSDHGSEKADDACEKKDGASDEKENASKKSYDASEKSNDASEKTDDASNKSDDVSINSVDASEKTYDVNEETDDARKMSDDASVELDEKLDDAIEKLDDASKILDDASKNSNDVMEKSDDVNEKSDNISEKSVDASEKTDDVSKMTDGACKTSDDASVKLDETSAKLDDSSGKADGTRKILEDASENSDDSSEKSDVASEMKDHAGEKTDDPSKKSDDAIEKTDDVTKKSDDASEKSDDVSEMSDDVSKKSVAAREKTNNVSKKTDNANANEKPDEASEKLDHASEKSDHASEKLDHASEMSDATSEKSDYASEKSDDASIKADKVSKKSDDVIEKTDSVSEKTADVSEKSDDASEMSDDASKTADDARDNSDESKKGEVINHKNYRDTMTVDTEFDDITACSLAERTKSYEENLTYPEALKFNCDSESQDNFLNEPFQASCDQKETSKHNLKVIQYFTDKYDRNVEPCIKETVTETLICNSNDLEFVLQSASEMNNKNDRSGAFSAVLPRPAQLKGNQKQVKIKLRTKNALKEMVLVITAKNNTNFMKIVKNRTHQKKTLKKFGVFFLMGINCKMKVSKGVSKGKISKRRQVKTEKGHSYIFADNRKRISRLSIEQCGDQRKPQKPFEIRKLHTLKFHKTIEGYEERLTTMPQNDAINNNLILNLKLLNDEDTDTKIKSLNLELISPSSFSWTVFAVVSDDNMNISAEERQEEENEDIPIPNLPGYLRLLNVQIRYDIYLDDDSSMADNEMQQPVSLVSSHNSVINLSSNRLHISIRDVFFLEPENNLPPRSSVEDDNCIDQTTLRKEYRNCLPVPGLNRESSAILEDCQPSESLYFPIQERNLPRESNINANNDEHTGRTSILQEQAIDRSQWHCPYARNMLLNVRPDPHAEDIHSGNVDQYVHQETHWNESCPRMLSSIHEGQTDDELFEGTEEEFPGASGCSEHVLFSSSGSRLTSVQETGLPDYLAVRYGSSYLESIDDSFLSEVEETSLPDYYAHRYGSSFLHSSNEFEVEENNIVEEAIYDSESEQK